MKAHSRRGALWSTPWSLCFYFSIFWLHPGACGIPVPGAGIEPVSPAVKVQWPNHWITREVPESFAFKLTWMGTSLSPIQPLLCLIKPGLLHFNEMLSFIGPWYLFSNVWEISWQERKSSGSTHIKGFFLSQCLASPWGHGPYPVRPNDQRLSLALQMVRDTWILQVHDKWDGGKKSSWACVCLKSFRHLAH